MLCMCVVFIRLRGPFGPVTCARTRKRRARHSQPFWREPKTLGWGARKPLPDHSRTDLKGHPRKTKRVAPSIRRSLARQQVGEEARSIFPALKKSVSSVKLYKSVFEYSQSEKRVTANKAEWRTFVKTRYSKNRRMQRLQKNLIKTIDHDYRLLPQCVDIVRSLNEDSDASDIMRAINRVGCLFGPGGILITTAGNLVDNLRRQYLAARTKHRKARKLFYDIMAACRDYGVHPPINAPRHYDFEEFQLSMLDGPFPFIYGMSAEWIDDHKSLVDKHGVGTMFNTFHEYHKLKHLDRVRFAADVSLTLASLNYDASYFTNPFSFVHAHYNKRKHVESRQKFVDEPVGKRWTTKITALSREEAREKKYDRSVAKVLRRQTPDEVEAPPPVSEQITKITAPVVDRVPVIIREYPEMRWKVTAPRIEPYAHFSPDRCPVKLVNINGTIHPIFGQKLALVLNVDDTFQKLRTRILHKFPVHTTLDGPGSGIYTWDFKDAEDVPVRQLIYSSQQTGNVLVLYCNTLNGTHGEATNEDDLDSESFHISPSAVYNRKFLQMVASRAASIEHIARGGPKYMFSWKGDDLEVDHGNCFDFRLVTQLDDRRRRRFTSALCDCHDCVRLSVSHVEVRLRPTVTAPVRQMHLPIVHRLSSVRSRVPILELARQIAEHCYTSTVISVTAHVRRREGCTWFRTYSDSPGRLMKDLEAHWQWMRLQDDADDDESDFDVYDVPYVQEHSSTRTFSGDEGSVGSGSQSDLESEDSWSSQPEEPTPSVQGAEEPHDDVSDHQEPGDNFDEYLDDLFFGNVPKDLSFYGDVEENYGDPDEPNFPPPATSAGDITPPSSPSVHNTPRPQPFEIGMVVEAFSMSTSPRDSQLGSSHGEITEGDDMGIHNSTPEKVAHARATVPKLHAADKLRLNYAGPDGDVAAIRKAHKAAMLRSHPDKNPAVDNKQFTKICADINAAKDRMLEYAKYLKGDKSADIQWYIDQAAVTYASANPRHTKTPKPKRAVLACEYPGCRQSGTRRPDGHSVCNNHCTVNPCTKCGSMRCYADHKLCLGCKCKADKCYEARTDAHHCQYHASIAMNGHCAGEYCRNYADQPGGMCSKCRPRFGCEHPGCAMPKGKRFCCQHETAESRAPKPPEATAAHDSSDRAEGPAPSTATSRSRHSGGKESRRRRKARREAERSSRTASETDAGPPTPHPETPDIVPDDAQPPEEEAPARQEGPALPGAGGQQAGPVNGAAIPQPAVAQPVNPAPQYYHWWYVSTDAKGSFPVHHTHLSREEEAVVSRFTPGGPVLVHWPRASSQFAIILMAIVTILAVCERRYGLSFLGPTLMWIQHKLMHLLVGRRPINSSRDLHVHHCFARLLTINDMNDDLRNPGSQSVRLRANGEVYAMSCYSGTLGSNPFTPQYAHLFMEFQGQCSVDIAKANDSYYEGTKDLDANVKTSTDRSCANHLINLDRGLQQGQVREETYYRMRSGHEIYHAPSPPLNMPPLKPWATWREVTSWATLSLLALILLRRVLNSGSQLRNRLNYVLSLASSRNSTLDMAWRNALFSV
nr:hypothetical protein [Tolivirales sp.]